MRLALPVIATILLAPLTIAVEQEDVERANENAVWTFGVILIYGGTFGGDLFGIADAVVTPMAAASDTQIERGWPLVANPGLWLIDVAGQCDAVHFPPAATAIALCSVGHATATPLPDDRVAGAIATEAPSDLGGASAESFAGGDAAATLFAQHATDTGSEIASRWAEGVIALVS